MDRSDRMTKPKNTFQKNPDTGQYDVVGPDVHGAEEGDTIRVHKRNGTWQDVVINQPGNSYRNTYDGAKCMVACATILSSDRADTTLPRSAPMDFKPAYKHTLHVPPSAAMTLDPTLSEAQAREVVERFIDRVETDMSAMLAEDIELWREELGEQFLPGFEDPHPLGTDEVDDLPF